MSTLSPDGSRELALVARVEFKIALAQTDEALQSILKTYLAPLLLKLASEHEEVRQKVNSQMVLDRRECWAGLIVDGIIYQVVSVCQHLDTRINAPSIQLPVHDLVQQFKNNSSSLIRHFDLVFINHGLGRLTKTARAELLPSLLQDLQVVDKSSRRHAANLFNLLLRVLPDLELPPRGSQEDSKLADKIALSASPETVTYIAERIGQLLLYHKARQSDARCPGLSQEQCQFLEQHGKTDTWQPSAPSGLNLAETKVVVAKFLASAVFSEQQRFLPALFASVDTNFRIAEIGRDMLKRAEPAISANNTDLLDTCFRLYLGEQGSTSSVAPVKVSLKIRLLALLSKSDDSPSRLVSSHRIIQEALAPRDHHAVAVESAFELCKLRRSVLVFISHLAQICKSRDLQDFSPAVIGQLRSFIDEQGWPSMRPAISESGTAGDIDCRAKSYECIGTLIGSLPLSHLVEPNLELLRWLLTSLSQDRTHSDVSMSIEHSLSGIIGKFQCYEQTDIQSALASLLSHHVGLEPSRAEGSESVEIVRSTRYIAVRLANRCLPFSNVSARLIDVKALSYDQVDRGEVAEEARRGLDPGWFASFVSYQDSSLSGDVSKTALSLPRFPDLIRSLFGPETRWRLDTSGQSRAYTVALCFVRRVLFHQALESCGSPPNFDGDWQTNIDRLLIDGAHLKPDLIEYFTQDSMKGEPGHDGSLETYLNSCLNGIQARTESDKNLAAEALLQILALLPDSRYASTLTNVEILFDQLAANDKRSREYAAHLLGLLTTMSEAQLDHHRQHIQQAESRINGWREAVGHEILNTHGAFLFLAYVLARARRRKISMDFGESIACTLISNCIMILVDSRDRLLQEAVFLTISELATHGILTPNSVSEEHLSTLLDRLFVLGKEGQEGAIEALGHLGMQCAEDPKDEEMSSCMIKDRLRTLGEIRKPELQLVVGDALSCNAVGWLSRSLLQKDDILAPPPNSASRDTMLSDTFSAVLQDCQSTKPALRQASSLWLLNFLQNTGHLNVVHPELTRCQAVFKRLLSDKDTLNQETASRGLTLVYERGDEKIRSNMVNDLVGSFIGSTASRSGQVTADTELFDAGALPTGDGSVTTYKDIMSLAAEVGDSSMVYRFMSLASSDALWSSRAAFGRFGLGQMLSKASDEAAANNPKLYAALFRYRFDPNSNVRSAMNSIWISMVKNPNQTIKIHFEAILGDLLKNIVGKEWRTRQASCAALADLLQGQSLESYERHLNEIWTLAFKLCDDIKESVRASAMSLARVLTGILTRSLEMGQSAGNASTRMLEQILPFLLGSHGLESSAAEVQGFSRKTLLDIVKKAPSKTLRGFVPNLVAKLLALLSSIEPEMINYVHMNAATFGVTKQELDQARLKHVRGSAMLEAIERCLDSLDADMMPAFIDHLEEATRTVIGLPSKVGCAKILASLSTRHNFIFRPYSDRMLIVARKQMRDRNETISSAYASACGYLARLASDEADANLIKECQSMYFDSEDDRSRIMAGDLVNAIAKHASDRYQAFATDICPFVFFAKHDIHEPVKEIFESTWNETVGGSRTILLYLTEIASTIHDHLGSSRWTIKHTASYACASIIESTGESLGEKEAAIVWPLLEKALAGKTWPGKERVLRSFVEFAKTTQFWRHDEAMAAVMEKLILREAKRNNAAYRPHALEALGKFAELRRDVDMYPQVEEVVKAYITTILDEGESSKTSDGMDIDIDTGTDKDGDKPRDLQVRSIRSAITALLQSISLLLPNIDQRFAHLTSAMSLIVLTDSFAKSNAALQTAIYKAIGRLLGEWCNCGMSSEHAQSYTQSQRDLDVALTTYLNYLTQSCISQTEYVRIHAAEALVSVSKQIKDTNTNTPWAQRIRLELVNFRSHDTSPAVRSVLGRANL